MNERGRAHYIELSNCLDFEPAASCSSDDDSSNEEPDSEDDRFIDDEEVLIEAEFNAAMETTNFAALQHH